MKNKLGSLLQIFVSAALLGLLGWLMRDEGPKICAVFRSSDSRFVLAGVMLYVLNMAVAAYRLKIIFKGEDINVSLWRATQLTYVGSYFNNFLPTAVGGDLVKAHYASRESGLKMKTYASVMMDRVIGLYSFLIMGAAALFIDRGRIHMPVINTMIFTFLSLGTIGFIVLTNKRVARFLIDFFDRLKMLKIGEKLGSLYEIVHDYRNRLDIVGKALLISVFAQSIYFVIVYFFFHALGSDINLGNVFLIMPVVTLVSMMPSLGGLGIREGAIALFFAPLSGKETAFAASLLLLAALLFISAIGGLFLLWWSIIENQKSKIKNQN